MVLIYYIIIKRKKQNGNSEDLSLIKENIRSIQQELQSFNLAQIKIENSLVRGGSQQQGEWGEFVLVNILENSGLRESHDFEIQPVLKNVDDKNPRGFDQTYHQVKFSILCILLARKNILLINHPYQPGIHKYAWYHLVKNNFAAGLPKASLTQFERLSPIGMSGLSKKNWKIQFII